MDNELQIPNITSTDDGLVSPSERKISKKYTMTLLGDKNNIQSSSSKIKDRDTMKQPSNKRLAPSDIKNASVDKPKTKSQSRVVTQSKCILCVVCIFFNFQIDKLFFNYIINLINVILQEDNPINLKVRDGHAFYDVHNFYLLVMYY